MRQRSVSRDEMQELSEATASPRGREVEMVEGGNVDFRDQVDDEQSSLVQTTFTEIKSPKRMCLKLSFWLRPELVWTLRLFLVWATLILISSNALLGCILLQLIACFLFWMCLTDLIRNRGYFLTFSSPRKARWYLLLVSYLILWKPGFYFATFSYFKPSNELKKILNELQFEERTTFGEWDRRPMQALFFGNSDAELLGDALMVHFDRFERNETVAFGYVKDLNLIGNTFDDQGIESVIQALDHPYSYTESLLVGRNNQIGDKTAVHLANLIKTPKKHKEKSEVYPDVAGQELTWLEIGGTSVTKNGLSELYHSMGFRPFSHLGLEYTRGRNHFLFFPLGIFGTSTIPRSFEFLHNARYLQDLTLTGNSLDDDDISFLAKEVVQTNITKLTLFNNKISPSGVDHLVPLVTQLTELALGMNRKIGDKGAIVLAEALKNPNATLQTLFLSKCNIGQQGAEALLSIFPGNTRLKFLVFGNKEKFDKVTMEALDKATRANWS